MNKSKYMKSLSDNTKQKNNACIAEVTGNEENLINAQNIGEIREIPYISFTGIIWKPGQGDIVQIIRNEGKDSAGVGIGIIPDKVKDIEPGEILLYTKDEDTYMHLQNDGTIKINGKNIEINGKNVKINGDTPVARKGDSVSVSVPGVGTCTGTITAGSDKVKVG